MVNSRVMHQARTRLLSAAPRPLHLKFRRSDKSHGHRDSWTGRTLLEPYLHLDFSAIFVALNKNGRPDIWVRTWFDRVEFGSRAARHGPVRSRKDTTNFLQILKNISGLGLKHCICLQTQEACLAGRCGKAMSSGNTAILTKHTGDITSTGICYQLRRT